MNKPTKKHVSEPVYDWNQCRDYIELKYKINLRDYYGKFIGDYDADVIYYDFWHVLTEHDHINNGSFMWFHESDVNSIERYSELDRLLFNMFFDEFGDGEMGERVCSFWVEW